jgi:4a-hydroxytetrahydrobiopterin dehydratase
MKLPQSEVAARLAAVPGWSIEGDALVRTFEFASFPDVVAFVTRLGFDAEANDHHPDLAVSYRRLRVTWSTHSDGGITEKDFNGAQAADRLARAFQAAGAGRDA